MTINVRFEQEEITGYWWAHVDYVKPDGERVRYVKSHPELQVLSHWLFDRGDGASLTNSKQDRG